MTVRCLAALLAAFAGGAAAAAPAAPGPAPAAPAPSPDEIKQLEEQTRRINELIDALERVDEAAREPAVKALLDAGPAALPYLEARLRKKGLADLVRVYVQLLRPDDEPIFRVKDFESRLPKVSGAVKDPAAAAAADRYLLGKYNEASANYREKQYDRALALANALLALDPKGPYRGRLRELKLLCEHQLLQRDLLAATLTPVQDEIAIGDEIPLLLRLENVSMQQIRLTFGAAAAPDGGAGAARVQGMAIGEVRAEMRDPLGMRRTARGSVVWSLPAEIVLPPKQRWEQRVVIRPNAAEEDAVLDPRLMRVYEVDAHLIAVRFWVGEQPERRRIGFEACTVKAWPRGVTWYDPDPLAGLGKTLDDHDKQKGPKLNDLYMAILRVPAKDADKAAALLAHALVRFDGPVRQVLMEGLKELTGLDYGYDVKKWLEWGNVRIEEKPPAPPPKEAAPGAAER